MTTAHTVLQFMVYSYVLCDTVSFTDGQIERLKEGVNNGDFDVTTLNNIFASMPDDMKSLVNSALVAMGDSFTEEQLNQIKTGINSGNFDTNTVNTLNDVIGTIPDNLKSVVINWLDTLRDTDNDTFNQSNQIDSGNFGFNINTLDDIPNEQRADIARFLASSQGSRGAGNEEDTGENQEDRSASFHTGISALSMVVMWNIIV